MIRIRTMPDGFDATNAPLALLIQLAYGVEENQIIGIPGPIHSQRYDIEAKVDSSDVPKLKDLTPKQRMQMLQPLLADRFQLKLHQETRQLSVYELVIAKNGPKLREAKPGDTYPNGIKGPDGHGRAGLIWMQTGQITFQGVSISDLTRTLAQRLGHNVIDKTGLTGQYDFTMQWPTEDNPGPAFNNGQGEQQSNSAESAQASIFTVIQEQLGLKLESRKAPVEVLVIDHVEPPSEN
jgi:bla regulator protein blaR1